MRVTDLGSTIRVQVSVLDVWKFNNKWPGSTLDGRQSFEFDKRTGDLVDRTGKGDGPEVVALSEDAQEWACCRLGIPNAHKAQNLA